MEEGERGLIDGWNEMNSCVEKANKRAKFRKMRLYGGALTHNSLLIMTSNLFLAIISLSL
jgi:hypothetical protein